MIYPQRSEWALDDVWRERVLDAEKIYRLSRARLDIAIQDFDRTGDPDDLMQAQDAHESAVGRYLRMLRVFHQLVLNGEQPERASSH